MIPKRSYRETHTHHRGVGFTTRREHERKRIWSLEVERRSREQRLRFMAQRANYERAERQTKQLSEQLRDMKERVAMAISELRREVGENWAGWEPMLRVIDQTLPPQWRLMRPPPGPKVGWFDEDPRAMVIDIDEACHTLNCITACLRSWEGDPLYHGLSAHLYIEGKGTLGYYLDSTVLAQRRPGPWLRVATEKLIGVAYRDWQKEELR